MPVSRRDWLAWSMALGAGACRAPQSQPADRSPANIPSRASSRIVVVGAGLAGLFVAHELQKQGRDVVVLEAQNRAGGRILTLRRPFAPGLFVEAGAAHVVGDPALLALLDELGVELSPRKRPPPLSDVEYYGARRRVIADGDTPTETHALSAEETALGWAGRLEKYFADVMGSDPRAPDWLTPARSKLDAISVARHLRAQGASAGYVASVGESLCAGGDAEASSALDVARHIAAIFSERKLAGGGRIAGGSDRLPLALRARLGDRLTLGADVRAIAQHESGAHVDFVHRGKRSRIDAERVVLAVPSSVLARIAFEPGLSAEKRRAAAELERAAVTRIFVESRSRFWIARGESGRADTDLAIGSIRHETADQDGARGILGAYLTGARARRFARMTETERIQAALDDVDRAHPGMRASFSAGTSKVWDEDPFVRGAYVWFRPGQLTRLGPALGAAEGRLHFAGDHTSYRPGFMHGALASARRVLDEIGA